MSQDYCPNTPEDIRLMLEKIGVGSVEDLFAGIPADLRAQSFDLPEGMSEFELRQRMKNLADANIGNVVPFVGAGAYDHFIPAVVDHLAGRAEFYTAYTPYQPECSQGTLQALYEYQTAICMLTGMEVSNASLYDGGTALAEAAMMAIRVTGRSKIVMDESVNPLYRQIVKTYLANLDVEVVEVAVAADLTPGLLSFEIGEDVAAVLVQNPNFFGTVSDFTSLAARVHDAGALLVMSVYPISLGLVRSPADMGADIVTGDGQSLGIPLSFGGPSFGFITTKKTYIRNMPGRIIGQSVDKNGKRGFVLTLQAREQHIKRHKATSNICSNQSLCALRGLIFLSSVGKEGLAEMSSLNRDKAEYAKAKLDAIPGISVLNGGATFNEFTIALPGKAVIAAEKLLAKGIAAGLPVGEWYEGGGNQLVVTVTEKRTKEEIDALARALEELSWS